MDMKKAPNRREITIYGWSTSRHEARWRNPPLGGEGDLDGKGLESAQDEAVAAERRSGG